MVNSTCILKTKFLTCNYLQYCRRRALLDAITLLEEKNVNKWIFIEPPTNFETDEDSGDEDGGMLDNLNKNQLQVPAVIEDESDDEDTKVIF